MYDLEVVKKDINTWILETLSTESPIFGNMPACPFAKKAILDDKVHIIIVDENTNYDKTGILLAKGNDVIVYIYNPNNITPEELTTLALGYNKKFPELVFLEDHPAEIESVQDFICNQGTYACIFGAVRSSVLKARHYLKSTHYYDNWDEEYKQEVWSR